MFRNGPVCALPPQLLPRVVIHPGLDLFHLLPGQAREVRSFRQEAPDNPVGCLVAAALVGRVRVAVVDMGAGAASPAGGFHAGAVRELHTVVDGDRPEHLPKRGGAQMHSVC